MRDDKGRFIKGHKQLDGSEKGWFRSGHGTWNKGKKTGIVPKTAFKKGQRPSPTTEFKKGQTPWNKGKPGYSLPSKGKPRPQTAGSKNYFWKGGKTKTAEYVRFTRKYKAWRQKVFERDNFVCQECGKRGGFLSGWR